MQPLVQAQGLIGIALVVAVAWALSANRATPFPWKFVAGALLLQLALALVIVRVPFVWQVIGLANDAVAAVERATLKGSAYMFGYTGGGPIPFALKEGEAPPLIIAFQILPLIIVFSALTSLLWHWGVLKALVRGLSLALRRTLGVSGVVGLAGGASLFLGVVEQPLVTRAWFDRISRSELFALMVLAMSNISGALLVLYATTIAKVVPDAVGHMISASLLSLPAAILIARLMEPGESATDAQIADVDMGTTSAMDAIVRGTMDGVQLFLAVLGIIIVVFALVALADDALSLLPVVDGAPLTLKRIFGWVFAPLMWAVGVPWSEAPVAGALMGTKAILNEYVAYLELAALAPGTLSPRATLITTYALCGVANLASVGLIVSTIGTLAPARRAEVASMGMRSWIAGNGATLMIGAMIGLVTPA
jgi:concentrative nucleoside transporter, CNT family